MRPNTTSPWRPTLLAVLCLAAMTTPGCEGCNTKGPPPPDLGYVQARVIETAGEGITGPLAGSVVGDVLMENERIRVVLQKPGRALALNPYGGNIIDADVIRDSGFEGDRFGEVGLFVNSTITMAPETMEIVEDGGEGLAVVRFEGPSARSDYINAAVGMEYVAGLTYPIDTLHIPELWFAVTYTLAPGTDHVVVDVELTNSGTDAEPLAAGWLIHGGLGENYYPEHGGFSTPQITSAGAQIVSHDTVAYGFGPLPYTPGAHGLAFMAGGTVVLDSVQVLDVLSWPDSATVHLAPGDTFEFDAVFVVAGDVSGVMSTLRGLADDPADDTAIITGDVLVEGTDEAAPFSRIAALDPSTGDVVAATTADGHGAYRLEVPAGTVNLAHGKPGWPYSGGGDTPDEVSVAASSDVEQTLFLPPTGALDVTVQDSGGSPLPARVFVLGIDPSPPYKALDANGADPLAPGVTATLDVPASGTAAIDLEPGEYDVVFTRGMEYDAVIEPITVVAGSPTTLAVTLNRVLDTNGMLSGDFHIHAAAGPDLVLTDEERVANYAADGVEVLIASNHAYVADLSPVVADLALESWVSAVPSQEITTFDYGHFGLFPMQHEPDFPNGGAFDWVGVSPSEIFDWGQSQDREMVVQINHPRRIPTPAPMQNYFTVLDLLYDEQGWFIGDDHFDPMGSGVPDDAVMFGPGFTAMEVMTWLNIQGFSDWFNLLSAGLRFTATSNSDSHTTRVEGSGWPRNFVLVGEDDPTQLDIDAYVAAVNDMQLVGSFGPLVTIEAEPEAGGDTVGMGQTLDGGGDPIRVIARVQAAPWVSVDTLDVYADGELVTQEILQLQEVDGAEGGKRWEQTLEIIVDAPQDTWIAVMVWGDDSLYPYLPFNQTDPDEITLERMRAGDVDNPVFPFAFANPIFVDADGDGQVTPSHHICVADWDNYRQENRLSPY